MKIPRTFLVVATCIATLSGCAREAADMTAPAADGTDAKALTIRGDGASKLTTLRSEGADPLGYGVRERMRVRQGEILVRFRKGTSAAAMQAVMSKSASATARTFRSVPGLRLATAAPGVNFDAALSKLRASDEVLYAEPNYIMVQQAIPNDPEFAQQWSLHNTGQLGSPADRDINAPEGWEITTGSNSVVVAVIDSGIDYNHEDLAANVYTNSAECTPDGVDNDGNGYADDCHGIDAVNGDSDPLDDEGHGTLVSGVIGAVGNNGIGVAGVAWNVKLLPCKFTDITGSGDTADAITCLDYIAVMRDRGVNIVASNNSWGNSLPSRALLDAIDAQLQRGILFIAPAGNDYENNDLSPQYPCTYFKPNVLCISALDTWGIPALFSGYGRATVLMSAHGVDIRTTAMGNEYGLASGTSFAVPHVVGAIALLSAQDPTRDWRALKNLVLAGTHHGVPQIGVGSTLNIPASMNCTQAEINTRLRPVWLQGESTRIIKAIGDSVELSVLHINCAAPAGNVTLSVQPTGETITLLDNGLGLDAAAADGIYTAEWTATTAGRFTFTFPNADDVEVEVDQYLKRGFPVKTLHVEGSYISGTSINALVGNIDADPKLEILASGHAAGPVYAWHADGSEVAGWPASAGWLGTVGYPSLGEFDPASPGSEVVVGYFAGTDSSAAIYYGNGVPFPAWPRPLGSQGATMVADVDGNGIDDVFLGGAIRVDGTPFNNDITPWASANTSAAGDIDGDGDLEFVSVVNNGVGISYGYTVSAQHHTGAPVAGFPWVTSHDNAGMPALGDVDGDGETEIVFTSAEGFPWDTTVHILGSDGVEERTIFIPVDGGMGGATHVLGDLDGDGFPEIIVQTGKMHVFKGDGSPLAGWPQDAGWFTTGGTDPIIGDITGDGFPDVITKTNPYDITIWDRHGVRLPGFSSSEVLLGQSGGSPALADIDLDGRNDLILKGHYWGGHRGEIYSVWALDLHGPAAHGPIEWGQFKGDAQHSGNYQTGKNLPDHAYLAAHVLGTGSVSAGGGIDCGTDCIELYSKGTVVNLTAAAGPGTSFVRWRGACAGTSPSCAVSVSQFTSVFAEFSDSQRLAVSLHGAGTGTVAASVGDLSCPGACVDFYASGIQVTLTATPSAGSAFWEWSGACTGSSLTCTVTMDQARQVQAWFRAVKQLTVTRAGNGNGSVATQAGDISCGATCSALFSVDSQIPLFATAAADSVFTGWSGGCTGTLDCTVLMDSDQTVTATFDLRPALSVSRSGGGTGTVTSNAAGIDCGADCSEFYDAATAVTLTAAAAADSTFIGWTGACTGTGTCQVTVDQVRTVNAQFDLRRALTVARSGNGVGSVTSSPAGIDCGADCTGTYDANTVVRLTAAPATASAFNGWSGGGCSGTALTCDVTMNDAHSVTAAFRSTASNPGGGGGGGGGGRLDWLALGVLAGVLAWRGRCATRRLNS